MPGTITEQLDTLYTTTWANRKMGLADNIFDATPFWYWLKANGGLATMEGGRRIEVSLRYGKSENVEWIGKGQQVGMGDMDHLTIGHYPWRYLVDSIVRFFVDDQQNRGKSRIIELMNSKIDTSQDTLIEEMETRLFGTASGIQMNGLQDLVADNPTTGTVGSINSATYTWWRNQVRGSAVGSFATNGLDAMRKIIHDCMNNQGMDRPQIIVSGQLAYEAYEDEAVTDHLRIMNKTLADMGFTHQEYKGIPMIWSSYCADARMYFLNTKFISFVYDPMAFFDMTDWKPIPNQVNDRAAQIITAGNLITNRRRCQGVLTGITA